jgi:hypothetical protein
MFLQKGLLKPQDFTYLGDFGFAGVGFGESARPLYTKRDCKAQREI